MATTDAYATNSGPSVPPSNDPSATGIVGNDFSSSVSGQITHVLWYRAAPGGASTVTAQVHIQSSQTLVTTQASGTLTNNTWNAIALSSPVIVTVGAKYTVSVVLPAGSSNITFETTSTDHTTSPVTAYGSLGRFKNAGFAVGDYPNSNDPNVGFGIGIRFDSGSGNQSIPDSDTLTFTETETTLSATTSNADMLTSIEAENISASTTNSDNVTITDNEALTVSITDSDALTIMDNQSLDTGAGDIPINSSDTLTVTEIESIAIFDSDTLSVIESERISLTDTEILAILDQSITGVSDADVASFNDNQSVGILSTDALNIAEIESLVVALADVDVLAILESEALDTGVPVVPDYTVLVGSVPVDVFVDMTGAVVIGGYTSVEI